MSNTIKDIDKVNELLSDVQYKGWSFVVRSEVGGFLLSLKFDSQTIDSLSHIENQLRKTLSINEWYISMFATDTEVVRTAYKAIMYVESFIVSNTKIFDWVKYHEVVASLIESHKVDSKEKCAIFLSVFNYKNWVIRTEERGDGMMVQLTFEAPDNDDPTKIEVQHCRKFYYKYGDINELHNTVQYAVQSAEEHECNEQFLYKGVQVYNPHIDLGALVDFVTVNEFDHR